MKPQTTASPPCRTSLRPAACLEAAVRLPLTVILALLCMAFSGATASQAPAIASDGLLPQVCPEGWLREGEVRHYTKDNLYEYINGEAELFFPFGFEDLATAAYARRTDPRVALVADIYRMGSVLSAFGVYSNYRNPKDDVQQIGAQGSSNPAQLLFYQDRYFVRLSASGTSELDEKTLEACAKALSARLPGPPTAPKELGLFPAGGVLAGTEKYSATGLFGYPFFKAGLSADVIIEGEKVKAFVVIEETPEAARNAVDSYDVYLRQSGRPSGLSRTEGSEVLSAEDPLYSRVLILRKGPHIFGLARLPDASAGSRFLADWAGQLRTP